MTRPDPTQLARLRDAGLLILRVGLGAAFLAHGWPKLAGGPTSWAGLGSVFPVPPPVVWGFIGALTEFGGGLLLIAGLLFRPICFFLFVQMLVALFLVHLRHGDPFLVYSHALEDAVVFLGLIFIGPGRYSADAMVSGAGPGAPGLSRGPGAAAPRRPQVNS